MIPMATTKLSATKSTSRAINYAEKRAVEKSGLNCDVDYAKSSFKAARELYGKTDGNQGHVIIQSFQPGEVTPEQCNQLGLALAENSSPIIKSPSIRMQIQTMYTIILYLIQLTSIQVRNLTIINKPYAM